jgi:hypothetical protein
MTEKSILTIREELQKSERLTITGALLGELIKKTAPELNVRSLVNLPTGTGSVSRFAETYLGDVLFKSGQQGSDLLYTIGQKSQTDDPKRTSDVWREFVRPKSPLHIICENTTEGEDPHIYVGPKVPASGFEIKNATYEELNQIREDFAKIVNEKPEFREQQELVASAPYAEWSNLLKKRGRDTYRQWVEFRIEKIIELFSTRLESFEFLNQQTRLRLCDKLKQSQRNTRVLLNPHVSSGGATAFAMAKDSGSAVKGDNDLQSVVIKAIRSLTEAEIRELRIPVGVFWDAIKTSR